MRVPGIHPAAKRDMIRRALCFGILLAGACALPARDEVFTSLKVGDDIYRNVTVTSVTRTHIYFNHSRGFANAKLKDLEPASQQHFHFDPAKAAAIESEAVHANALYVKALQDTPPARRVVPSEPVPPAPSGPTTEVPPHAIHAKSFLNQQAPALTVQKWLTAPPELNGKFVLVDFWATWCGPCRRSIPGLNQLHARFKDRLVIIGLSAENEPAVRRMSEPKIEYAVAIDTGASMQRAVEVKGIPHALLIDPKGIVRFEGMPHYLDEKNLETLLTRYSL